MKIQFAPTTTVLSIIVPTDISELVDSTRNMAGANSEYIVNLVIINLVFEFFRKSKLVVCKFLSM